MDPEYLSALEGRLTGVRSEGERITLHIVPLENLWRASPDAKALSALTLYWNLKESGELPARLGVATQAATRVRRRRNLRGISEESEKEEPLIAATVVVAEATADPSKQPAAVLARASPTQPGDEDSSEEEGCSPREEHRHGGRLAASQSAGASLQAVLELRQVRFLVRLSAHTFTNTSTHALCASSRAVILSHAVQYA